MITVRLCTDAEVHALERQWAEAAKAEAWRQWMLASCEERHGGHLWQLDLHHPDDGAGVHLGCSYCLAGVDDVYFDGHDLIFLEADGITVAGGRHDSPRAAVIPVSVEPWGAKYWTDYGWEYDAGLDVWPTGPVLYLDEEVSG